MPRTVPRSPTTLAPVPLTPEEAAAVAVALAAQPAGPYAAAGRVALDKVLATLEPDAGRREALRAGSLLVRAEADRAGEVRSVVDEGLARHRVLVLGYRDGKGRPTRRLIEPLLLARTGEREYLVAWCRERQAVRWFRWDRIEGVQLTGEPAPRRAPATFGAPPAEGHPAGRALGRTRTAEPGRPPRLTVLPGGRD